MSDIELKPCPFCGGEVTVLENRFSNNTTGYQAVCSKCYSSSAIYKEKKNALKSWNFRPFENVPKDKKQREDYKNNVSSFSDILIENQKEIKRLKEGNERLKKELDDLKKEDLLRADTKKVIDYALKEGIIEFPSLKSNAQRFREALETICAIYEINGAEWRFDRNLYEVAKEALEGKDD